MTSEAEIERLEDARYAAMIAGDAAILSAMLADGLVYTHSSGATDDKASYIAGVASGKFTYHAVERPSETIRVYGDAALVSGEVRIDVTVGGVRKQLRSRHLNVWIREKSGWKMAAWESTPIAG
jgi:ketosteroid isomerase-like protein